MDHHLSILSFFLFISLIDIKAQNPNTTEQADSVINNFEPSLAIVIGLLSIIFSITFILLLYAKYCHRRRTTTSPNDTIHQIQDGLLRERHHPLGVDQTVLETLPMFRFSWLKESRKGLECSVCLARFEDIEILRLLPKCKHAFHISCIDQWLEQHPSCPLCRQIVGPGDFLQLPYSDSLRFLWNQTDSSRHESNPQISVGREDEFVAEIDPSHKFNHKINIVSEFVFKNRWSNLSSSDLIVLNSEMLNDVSSTGLSSLDSRNEDKDIKQEKMNHGSESKWMRSMSEIIVHPRFRELENRDSCPAVNGVKEERRRRVWIRIARKTVEWFANRETRINLQSYESTHAQNV